MIICPYRENHHTIWILTMALPARLIIYAPGNKPLAGPVPVDDLEVGALSGSEIHEFFHTVYTIQKDYFYALLYGVDFVRKHEPLRIIKPIDKLSVLLLGYLAKGTFLPRVEIRWYEFDKKSHRESEYFRMTLEHVRLNSIATILHDAKDPDKEHYHHLEAVSFCYQKITWLYVKGHILHTDIWNGGFFREEDEKDFAAKKSDDETDKKDEAPLIEQLKVTFTEGVFVKPDKGFLFDKKAKVRFAATFNRKPELRESKVFAKLYAIYNNKTEDLRQTQEGSLRPDGTWETEFTLRKPESFEKDKNRKPDAQVEYYAEIENKYAAGNFKGESIKVPEAGEEEIIVPWFIDVHAHVQSTNCCPAPLTIGQLAYKPLRKVPGTIVNAIVGMGFGTPGTKTTEEIAASLMKTSEAVLNEKKFDLMGEVSNRRRLVVNMPMDMDFGHWGGYEGRKIYERDEKDEKLYWENSVKGRKNLTKRNFDGCVKFRQQLDGIQNHFKTKEDGFVSFFHYDPRRWSFLEYNIDRFVGKWDDPFKLLIQANGEEQISSARQYAKIDRDQLSVASFSAIGFKMYTALGYRPDDFIHLPDLPKFYQKCSEPDLGVPIICHCSRGGLTTHEWRYYYQQHSGKENFDKDEAIEWYTQEFISPHAWEKVLQKYPNLKLCLAHFGGEECWDKRRFQQKRDWFEKLIELMKSPKYPNVYVDLAYFLFDDNILDQFADVVRDEKVRKKILFGTDWYLMEMEWTKIGLSATYKNYFERMYKGLRHEKLKAIDKTLPAEIMVLNPMRFLGLKKLAPKIDLLRKTLGKNDANLTSWINEIPDSADAFQKMLK
jgi:type VI secretion system Hcp family effector